MPYANLKFKGHKNPAPEEAPLLDKPSTPEEINLFNALMGAPFKCNVCGKNHRSDSRLLTSCFYKGYNKPDYFLVPAPRPFANLTVHTNRYYSWQSKFLFQVYLSVANSKSDGRIGRFHPWLLLIDHNWARGDISYKIKDLIPIKTVLAAGDYAPALTKLIKSSPEYRALETQVNEIKELIAGGRFDFNNFGLGVKDDDIINLQDDKRIIDLDTILYYYLAHFTSYNTTIECRTFPMDFFILVTGITRLFIRINPLIDYVPKIGIWANIDEALSACPPESWQAFRKIEF